MVSSGILHPREHLPQRPLSLSQRQGQDDVAQAASPEEGGPAALPPHPLPFLTEHFSSLQPLGSGWRVLAED